MQLIEVIGVFLLGLISAALLIQLLRPKAQSSGSQVMAKRSQEALGVLQTFYEHAPTLLGVVEINDQELRHIYDNPAACTFFGTLPGQTQGKLESQLRVPQEQTALWRKYFDSSLSQAAPLRFEFKSREHLWLAVTVCPIIDDSTSRQRFCYLAEDISEWKSNAEQAHLDRERLKTALETGRLGFWDWDLLTGQVHYGGDWERITGYKPEELNPHISAWENLLHPDDSKQVMDELSRSLNDKAPEYEVEYRLKTKSGVWLWVASRGRVVERSDMNRAVRHVGVLENTDDKRRVREQLKLAAQQKDEFLATLAHELRNPLAPIRTGLAIIKRDPSSASAQQARDMMERQLIHLVRLIDDLLDVSRICLGRLELKKSDVSLQSIVDSAVEGSMPFIEANKHTLTVELPDKPVMIFGDLTRLAQVVSNLLNNSAKYTPHGGKISLQASLQESTVTIRVIDNGLGIPNDMLERIFDMFGQVNRTLDRAQGGLGIGLALVRRLVELHGGTIKAESAGPGLGSTFTVILPATPKPTNQPSETPGAKPVAPSAARKILVIDDNVDGAESLAMFLRLEGHTTHIANSASEGLRLFEEFSPDLVFLDIGLPEMNGYDVARQIRAKQNGKSVCLVAITGWGTSKDKESARDAGFNAHLTKPVDLDVIELLVQSGTGSTIFKC